MVVGFINSFEIIIKDWDVTFSESLFNKNAVK